MGWSLFEQLLNTQRRVLPFFTNTKQKQKAQLKLKTSKTVLEKRKEDKEENQQEK